MINNSRIIREGSTAVLEGKRNWFMVAVCQMWPAPLVVIIMITTAATPGLTLDKFFGFCSTVAVWLGAMFPATLFCLLMSQKSRRKSLFQEAFLKAMATIQTAMVLTIPIFLMVCGYVALWGDDLNLPGLNTDLIIEKYFLAMGALMVLSWLLGVVYGLDAKRKHTLDVFFEEARKETVGRLG